ncbi:hypothetical protein HPP92_000258 [Vanilla planifolia]|uniref:Uncharacterized protein n=1 Tax=Vanilla planifolia TaxID=51239 RepID=A0A835S0Y5_VANPL|nr:hypothetical protein HPP92_000249 [Vanilla planifolia]KAG0500186.1 hypothetical protein HPP92_000258 [Vanilla planifolia]
MLSLFACGKKEKVVSKQEAPGKCPHCGGAVMATVVEEERRLCRCLTLCLETKRKFSCSLCSRRLHSLLP